jgi:hypothetical protein
VQPFVPRSQTREEIGFIVQGHARCFGLSFEFGPVHFTFSFCRPMNRSTRRGPMKFLVIRKPRTGTGMTPTVEMIRAHKEVVLSAVKRGDADYAYAFLGGGGFSVQNANSAEELNERLMSSPLELFYEFDVRALTDYGKFMDTVAEAFQKQKH